MSQTIKVDQAIFTSTRTATGEGYRIIAASAGVRADEKQAITRNSPSHDSLCSTSPDTQAVAFYSLPSGRFCAAISCYAGAEHTGRGGQRIYTHNVIVDATELASAGHNPFVILRAMISAGMLNPQLTPTAVLPEHELTCATSDAPIAYSNFAAALGSAARCHILQRLIDDSSLVIHLEKDWQVCAEAILQALPAPMRQKVSFAAGMKFSVGRSHRMHLLSDEKGLARTKVTGQRTEYVEPSAVVPSNVDRSAWVDFAERHWAAGDFTILLKRASRPFTDMTPPGRERIGRLYNFIDEITRTEPTKLLSRVGELLGKVACPVESDLRQEYVNAAQNEIANKFRRSNLTQLKPNWSAVVGLWRRNEQGTVFAHPLIMTIIRTIMMENPLVGAEMALEVASNLPPTVDQPKHTAFIEEVLTQLRQWAVTANGDQFEPLSRICNRWRALRPMCPIIRETAQKCHESASGAPR